MPLSQPAQPGYGGLAGSKPLCTRVSRVLPSDPSSSQLEVKPSANRSVALRPGSSSTNLAPPGSSSKPPIAKRPPTWGRIPSTMELRGCLAGALGGSQAQAVGHPGGLLGEAVLQGHLGGVAEQGLGPGAVGAGVAGVARLGVGPLDLQPPAAGPP